MSNSGTSGKKFDFRTLDFFDVFSHMRGFMFFQDFPATASWLGNLFDWFIVMGIARVLRSWGKDASDFALDADINLAIFIFIAAKHVSPARLAPSHTFST